MAIRPARIVQVAIPVHDLERAKAFYGSRLGLAHLFDAPPGLSFFQCGETRLMLSQPEGPESAAASILYYDVPERFGATSYNYTILNDQPVLVEPRSRRVIQVID